MTSRGDQLVEEYLRRFDNASVFLPDHRRAELRQEIVEHIEAGTEEAQTAHADAVRTVLDRLGPPADIVASETDSGSLPEVDPAAFKEFPSAGGAGHDGDKEPPTEGSPGPVPPSRFRRSKLPLIGAVLTAVVVGAVAFAVLGVSSESDEPVQRPTPTPSHSGPPDSERSDRGPESNPATSPPPSTNSTPPGSTPSETPSSP